MKHYVTNSFNYKVRAAWAALGLAFLLTLSSGNKTFAQVYADEEGPSDIINCALLGCGSSEVSSPGAAADGSDSDLTKATLRSWKAILGTTGSNVYTTISFDENVPAGKTVYVRIDPPTATGLLTNLLGIVSLFSENRITAQLRSGASAVSQGTAVATQPARIVTDATGTKFYIAVTPTSNSSTFNAVRITVAAQVLELLISEVTLNVYNAFYYEDGVEDICGVPTFASLGEVGGAGLNVSLSDAVSTPEAAVDNDIATASGLGGGGVDLTLLSSLSQTLYFKKTSAPTDQAVVYLSFQTALVNANLLNGLTIQAFNGAQSAGPATGVSNLLNANVLDLITVGDGVNAGVVIPFYYTPTLPFDRITISLGSAVNVSLLGSTGVRIFGAGQVTPKPTLSSEIVYQFSGATPSVTASVSTGDLIYWQGPLDDRTNLTANPVASPAPFPIPVSANGDYVAVSVQGAECTLNPSDSTRLRVVVLNDISDAIPAGVSGEAFPADVFIRAASDGYAVTYTTPTGLPAGIDFNTTTGELLPNGNLPVVTETTTYNVVVGILVDGNPTGLTLTKTITVDPKLSLPGGVFPYTMENLNTYVKNISESVSSGGNGSAAGGRTGATLEYSLTEPGARIAAAPSGFSMSANGDLNGDPSAAGEDDYDFTVYVTDGIQTASATYILRIVDPLPVTLVDFKATAEGTTASLSWSTSEESNSDRFDVERSQNGKVWSKIGSVKSNTESKTTQYYNYSDASPIGGRNFYRLKMVDLDETFNYSRIIEVKFENMSFVSPNPIKADENLKITLTDWSNVKTVKVINTAGKTVFESSNALSTGISTRNLAAGAYVVKIVQNDGTVLTHRFVRQ
ncbi:T9SS type A sorting domain-containing protein [Dyadobacter aurulentus]|uniref:T9SS type A sorting domain-containing protein n=1 Tax=Dyadobacter sp. UC 10 TaxID=2605428 RepID=UPI0011F147AA|nr:T9SS type A sorting domain-containing protein [Dyadobacter sp. UC 10]KAA0989026.1 T9SS type A sorting domain-containing protein [Dyadobacter sp. UC 10]